MQYFNAIFAELLQLTIRELQIITLTTRIYYFISTSNLLTRPQLFQKTSNLTTRELQHLTCSVTRL